MIKKALILIFVLLHIQCKVAPKYTIASYPDVRTDMKKCGRAGKSATGICDPDSVVSPQVRDQVDAILTEIQKNTTSPCDKKLGFKVVFLLMRSIANFPNCKQ